MGGILPVQQGSFVHDHEIGHASTVGRRGPVLFHFEPVAIEGFRLGFQLSRLPGGRSHMIESGRCGKSLIGDEEMTCGLIDAGESERTGFGERYGTPCPTTSVTRLVGGAVDLARSPEPRPEFRVR